MKQTLTITYDTLQWEEMDNNDQALVEKAKNSCKYSYAPFSEFHVGCALQLEEGIILTGNNQENASFPCGTCVMVGASSGDAACVSTDWAVLPSDAVKFTWIVTGIVTSPEGTSCGSSFF